MCLTLLYSHEQQELSNSVAKRTFIQPVFKMQDSETGAPDGRFTTYCGAHYEGVIGAVAPTGGAGTVAMCWVTPVDDASSVTGTMIIRPIQGIDNNTGMAFDAGFESIGNPLNALAYCPASSHESVAGRLYAALGEATSGGFDGTIALHTSGPEVK